MKTLLETFGYNQLLATSKTENHVANKDVDPNYRLILSPTSWLMIEAEERYKYCYKIRIHPPAEQVSKAWDAIVPVLIREGLSAKVASQPWQKTGVLSEQHGKQIVIYGDYTDGPLTRNWQAIVTEIAQILKKSDIEPGSTPHSDTNISMWEGDEQVQSAISYRDEREPRVYWRPERHETTPLKNSKPHDPFATMVINLNDKINEPELDIAQMRRRKRQDFVNAPMLDVELEKLDWADRKVVIHIDDKRRFKATLAKWGIDFDSLRKTSPSSSDDNMESNKLCLHFPSLADWEKVPSKFKNIQTKHMG